MENFDIQEVKGDDEDRGNGAGPRDDVQVSGTYSDAVRQKILGCEGGDVEDPGGVLPPGGQTDCGDDGETCGGRYVGISLGCSGSRISGLIPHTGVHLEKAGDYCVTGGMLPHI